MSGNFIEIVYYSAENAEAHLKTMRDILHDRGFITVRDYYRAAEDLMLVPEGIHEFVSDDLGWSDLSSPEVKVVYYEGACIWVLGIPRPEPLSRVSD